MSSSAKLPISFLPLPPASHTLTKNLTPDTTATSPKEFRQLQRDRPSSQRRARLLSPETHFSYVTPCPLPFPYKITPEEGDEVTPENQAGLIERWLSAREALKEPEPTQRPSGLRLYYPSAREQSRELLSLSTTGLQDCLPQLDVGDAFEVLGTFGLSEETDQGDHPAENNLARQELIDVLSGHATLMNVEEDNEKSWAPWSLRYSGHQFGNWAGQLGDGRAISICTFNVRCELLRLNLICST